MTGIAKWLKNYYFGFLRKILGMPKMMEMGNFWDQNQHVWTFLQIASSKWNKWAFLGSNALFWNSVPWIFLKLCLMTGIEKWVKVRVWDFKGKLLLCPKWGKWVIFGPNINILKFFLILFIKFLWNCTWWQTLESFIKRLVCI